MGQKRSPDWGFDYPSQVFIYTIAQQIFHENKALEKLIKPSVKNSFQRCVDICSCVQGITNRSDVPIAKLSPVGRNMENRSVVTPMHCPAAHHRPSGAPVALETYNRVMPAPTIYQILKQHMAQAVAAAPQSQERSRCFSKIYICVMGSKKLWRDYQAIADGYYNDAVQDMWQECFGAPESYDPNLQEVTTWLNDSLKRALRRHRDRRRRDQNRHLSTWTNEDGDVTDATDNLESRPDAHDAVRKILALVLAWVKTDPDGTLRQRIFRKRPEITAQALMLRRLPPQSKPWPAIVQEFGLTGNDAKTLPQWYSRHCYPLLRAFGAHNDLL